MFNKAFSYPSSCTHNLPNIKSACSPAGGVGPHTKIMLSSYKGKLLLARVPQCINASLSFWDVIVRPCLVFSYLKLFLPVL